MWDLEDLGGLRRDPTPRRSIEPPLGARCDASAPEDEQVEIELTRAPALARPAAELALERLERGQEGDRAPFRVRQGGDVEGDTALRNSGWSVTPTGSVA
jgi:hypothetical protein